ncbi:MAG: chitin deacetylase family protein [Bacteroidota bacterium]
MITLTLLFNRPHTALPYTSTLPVTLQNLVIVSGLIGFGGLLWLLWSQPRWLLSAYESVKPGVRFFVKTDERIVALTIDDGPHIDNTPKILEILAQTQSQATFFLITNRVDGAEDLVTEIVRKGHEIGNHLTEDEPSIQLSPEDFEAKLVEAHQTLSKFAPMTWLRPGSGWYTAEMIAIACQHHYQVALGSVFPYDTHAGSVWFASRFILANIHPGSIIVLHDGERRGQRTAETLANVLPVLKQRGYRVVSLSELVNNH